MVEKHNDNDGVERFHRNIEARISTVEANYERILEDVHNLADSLERHADRTSTAIESIVDKLAATKVPQWGALASWAAVILTVMGLLMLAYGKDQARIEFIQAKQTAVLESLNDRLMALTVQQAKAEATQTVYESKIIPDMEQLIKELTRPK